MDLPHVSVIVPVFNGMPSLAAQAEALLNQDFNRTWELIYVDNGSRDGSAQFILGLTARANITVRLIDGSMSRGQVFARNTGAANARSNLLVFHDQDDLAHPSWLSELAKAMETSDAAGGFVSVTSPGREPDLSPQPPTGDLHVLAGRFRTALGTNFAIRRPVFEAIGKWRDIGVFAGEDIDICARLELAGHSLRYVPSARVTWRARHEFVAVFRQAMTYGRADIRIFLLWSAQGATLPRVSDLGRHFLSLVRKIVGAPFSRETLLKEFQRVGWSWGHLVEKWRFGLFGFQRRRDSEIQTYLQAIRCLPA